jgi:23S rRNA pseudouridine1911/1915/1917 synthase
MKTWTWTIPKESSTRADKLIYEALLHHQNEHGETLSRTRVQQLMDAGKILADTQKVEPKSKLKAGQKIQVTFPPPIPLEVLPENQPLEVLYEDQHLLVVNKPPGLTVHPSNHEKSGTLVNILLHHIQDLSGIGGTLRPGIVHRIDKDTSGALVITKNDETHQKMMEIFARHKIERRYWAICYGSFGFQEELTVQTQIGRNPTDRKKMAVLKDSGRTAISHLKNLKEYGIPSKKPFASLVEAKLETGRTHQVRVHLTHLGYSLLADPVYGIASSQQPKWKALPKRIQEAIKLLPGQALHARILAFEHPISKKQLSLEAPLPPAFQSLLDQLKPYSE